MTIKKLKGMNYGISIENFDVHSCEERDIKNIKQAIYQEKMVVLKHQVLNPQEFVYLGRKLGRLETYYQDMYHHPEEKEIFVSSNIQDNGTVQGVPKTGLFWHSDYAFMPAPFAFTMIYPQIVPKMNRGTYFIDMAEVYRCLPNRLKEIIHQTQSEHSIHRYFKIRPSDVYRPIGHILKEISQATPPVTHPTVIVHPATGEEILYINEGFTTSLQGIGATEDAERVLRELLAFSGQLDTSYTHSHINLLEIEKEDIVIWDNRRFVHHAKHSSIQEPSKTYRLTLYDEFPFSRTPF